MKTKKNVKREPFLTRLKKWMRKIRYQKFVTTFLYMLLLAIIIYTFWEYNYVGESVGPEVYEKTLDTLLGLLVTTGALKTSEVIGSTVEKVAKLKYNPIDVVDDMRGGE